MMGYKRKSSSRQGMAAIEVVMICATFVLASVAMFNLATHVITIYFQDGNQAIASPLI